MSEQINTEHKHFTPKGSKKEEKFLDGPNSRWSEFKFMMQVMKEFVYGFRKLHFVGPCVTVFGSARFGEDHKYYELTRQVGREVAKLGFTVMTGGGPGAMEAANRGAKEVGGKSVGCNIVLPHEQHPNQYLDLWVDFDFFFVRKTLLSKYSYAFVVMPGGYGTLDEFFEAMTLIQTGKFQRFPIVLMGVEYHQALYEHIQGMVKEKTIDENDLKLFLFTDSVEEAIAHIDKYAVEVFELKRLKTFKPIKVLGERKLKPNIPG
jgi:uncharacterized protein (TIGR00730 family)